MKKKTSGRLPSITVAANVAVASQAEIAFFGQAKKGGHKSDSGKKAKPQIIGKSVYAMDLIERLNDSEVFAAGFKGTEYLRLWDKSGPAALLAVGLGPEKDITAERIRQSGAYAFHKLQASKQKKAFLSVDAFSAVLGKDIKVEEAVQAFLEGFLLSSYKFDKYKTGKDKKSETSEIELTVQIKGKSGSIEDAVDLALKTSESIFITRDWSNEPANIGTPESYAAAAKKLAADYGLKYKVLDEAAAKKEGMHLFLSVGAGSDRESQMIVLEYNPAKSKKSKTIALVGKGITFDTGGISIKPSAKMEEMKHDMTGAATMMGAIVLAAQLKCPNRIVAILAMAENMPSGGATVPSSVIATRNGKTVEILNTDAEGRLVLADALDYAHDFKPDVIVDAATLTGAVGIALGVYHSAIFTDDKEIERTLRDIGQSNREGLWPLPMTDDYIEDMRSETADLRNHVNHPYGGTCRAAAFLKQFIKNDTKWVHIDMANTSNDQTYVPYWPKKGATGVFVRTIAQFASEF